MPCQVQLCLVTYVFCVKLCLYARAQVCGSNSLGCHAGHQELAGVAPQMNLRNSLQSDGGQTSPDVQNSGISGPTKKTDIL